MDREAFVARFRDVFEGGAWVAERAHALELGSAHDTALGLHNALCRAFRAGSEAERAAILTAGLTPQAAEAHALQRLRDILPA